MLPPRPPVCHHPFRRMPPRRARSPVSDEEAYRRRCEPSPGRMSRPEIRPGHLTTRRLEDFMSVETGSRPTSAPGAYESYEDERGRGWLPFSGALLLTLATLNIIDGI